MKVQIHRRSWIHSGIPRRIDGATRNLEVVDMAARDDRTDKLDSLTILRERIPLGRLTVLTGKPHAVQEVIVDLVRAHTPYVHMYDDYREDTVAPAIRAAAQAGARLDIDTFEHGLHYTEIEAALEKLYDEMTTHGVQVALTTQSTDVIEALATLCGAHPDADIRLTKCELNLPQAPSLSPKEIQIAVKQGIEVR